MLLWYYSVFNPNAQRYIIINYTRIILQYRIILQCLNSYNIYLWQQSDYATNLLLLKIITITWHSWHCHNFTHLGATSQPCCISVLKTNHRLFHTENSFFIVASAPDVSMCHSYGENRPTRNSTTLTPI